MSVDCNTQFFTGSQWKNIDQMNETDRILQYNPDGTTEMVFPDYFAKYNTPQIVHVYRKYGRMIDLDLMVTEDHVIPFINSENVLRRFSVKDMQKIMSKYNDSEIGDVVSVFKHRKLPNQLIDNKTLLALFVSTFKGMWLSGDTTSTEVVFSNRLLASNGKRMLQRIKEIYSDCGCKMEYKQKNEVVNGHNLRAYAPIRIPDFYSYLMNCSETQLQFIYENFETLLTKQQPYLTVAKVVPFDFQADVIQYIYTTRGIPTKTMYKTMKHKNYSYLEGRPSERHEVIILQRRDLALSTFVFETIDCPNGVAYNPIVPSGMWVSRRNGVITILGNSPRSIDRGVKLGEYRPTMDFSSEKNKRRKTSE